MRWTLVPLLLALAWAPAGTTELPGVGDGSITPETLFAFNESVKMIQPPPGLPQKWFSADAEVIATVAAATSTDVFVVEPLAHSQAGRRVRLSGSSAAAGQIRQIVSNSSHEIDDTPPLEVPPAAGDSV